MSDTVNSCSDNAESSETQCETPSDVEGSLLLSNPTISSVEKGIGRFLLPNYCLPA